MAIDDQPMNVYWSGKRTETINRSKINYKGSVATFSDLPDTNNQTGDMYSVTNLNGENYIWDGMAWDALGTSDANVVHKSGAEIISGKKTFNDEVEAKAFFCKGEGVSLGGSDNSSRTLITGSSSQSWKNGARLLLYGAAYSVNAGGFDLCAGANGVGNVYMTGLPDGTLTWNGQAIQTSSDARVKTPLSNVPDAVLDAWEAVEWGEFRYLDAVERKGKAARLHLGLIAQAVKAAFEARGLDACDYGILCHEMRPAKGDVSAVDLWMVRYAEAQAMEAAYQRRRAERAEARIKALEDRLSALEAKLG